MTQYRVTLITDAMTSIEVEADSESDAIELAYDKAPGSLCHQCSGDYDISDLSVYDVEVVGA